MSLRVLLNARQTLDNVEPDWPERVPVQPGDIVVQRDGDSFHVFRHDPDAVEGEIGVLVFASLNAALEIAREAQGDVGEQDTAAGMAWWNAQSEAARNFWLDRAGPGASAADAWEVFKACRGRREARP